MNMFLSDQGNTSPSRHLNHYMPDYAENAVSQHSFSSTLHNNATYSNSHLSLPPVFSRERERGRERERERDTHTHTHTHTHTLEASEIKIYNVFEEKHER
jgi:hypothetical protein